MTSDWAAAKKKISIEGHDMTYVERGQGRPIVFLHGNPTSSFLWRDVIPECEHLGRCIAPDLIGMGDSAKLPNPGPDTYTFQTHRRFLEGFLAAVGVDKNAILVIHDWGSALGSDWANRHRNAVAGIAYMESIVKPLADWSEFNPDAAPIFQGFRSEKGEELILDRNLFVDRVLPGSILRDLSAEEQAEYRRPFQNRDDRWPTLTWPRQIPIGGEPADVTQIASEYAAWMAENDLPKLFINADPGAILIGAPRDFCRTWKNQHEVTVKGSHFIQEDSGAEIGRAVAGWLEDAVGS
ncbi:haloalkane dehalogenase [Labrenzia sp. R4_2]|uniref:haloalkane dehalogenase n=1 Tax=Labrenzia sp. R4_2 TaxID=2821107 RepID=UPI001ADD5D23|nr:haloalkane dehalogenase [Labrenzia sp. R4_2]MBO9420236.1 haloalkane dehalogenase [Labrenzia sp. R4_2]